MKQKKTSFLKLSGIILEERGVIRTGFDVFHQGECISSLTSGSLSPSLGKGIGLAYIDLPLNSAVSVEVRGSHLNARVVRLPFL